MAGPEPGEVEIAWATGPLRGTGAVGTRGFDDDLAEAVDPVRPSPVAGVRGVRRVGDEIPDAGLRDESERPQGRVPAGAVA
ncbi:hypothetical protein JCM18882A_17260 [Brevibacterium metallidurans]|uniref:Uncharacterized protein n=1 Tax=Brevibacterium metallidurans TaxID=1482676 RepID=A0ABN0SLQ9_9MICO